MFPRTKKAPKKEVKKETLKRLPPNATEKLVYYQILNGDFNEPTYWNNAETEFGKLEREVVMWKKENPRSHKLAFEDWYVVRRRIYNQRAERLREKHQVEENKILNKLQKRLNDDFGFDYSPVDITSFEGTMVDLYFAYKKIVQEFIAI